MIDPLSLLPIRKILGYGWRPSLPDARDFKAKPLLLGTRPAMYSMIGKMPPIYDQGDSGSCTGNATAAAIDYNEGKAGRPFIYPSRLFAYYNARVIKGSASDDSGATVPDIIKSVATLGVCTESDWPFTISQLVVRPTPNCYADALPHLVTEYASVGGDSGPTVDDLCNQLAGDEPIVFGTAVYTSFESDATANSGLVPMPNVNTEKLEGGHCMLIVGYDDTKQLFTVRNSWGTGWGVGGYCYIPYAYMTNPNITDDFWCIRSIRN